MKLLRLILVATLILLPVRANADQGLSILTNNIRVNAGLTKLTESAILDDIALKRAHEISKDFAHRSINPEIDANFSCWQEWGGNIEWASPITSVTDAYLVQQWYDSPEHRAIMLGDFDLIGSAVYVEESTDKVWAVQIFLRTCDDSGATGNTANASPNSSTSRSTPQKDEPVVPDSSGPSGTQNLELPNTSIQSR